MACGQTFAVSEHQFLVVIHETDDAEAQGHQKRHPDVAIIKIRPQQGCQTHRDQNECATHGRSTRL